MSAIKCANCGGVGESSLATVYCYRCYSELRAENIARVAQLRAAIVHSALLLDRWLDFEHLCVRVHDFSSLGYPEEEYVALLHDSRELVHSVECDAALTDAPSEKEAK